jgi:hypothetical protein
MPLMEIKKYKYYIFFGIVTALTVCLPVPYIAPILIMTLGLFLGLFLITCNQIKAKEYIFLSSIFILAFLLRIISGFLFYNFIYLSNQNGLLGDSLPYSENGYAILQMWLSGIRDINYIKAYITNDVANLSGTIGGYDFWNAIVYFFTGKSPFSLIFINCIAGSVTAILIYYITKQLYNEKAAKISAILTAFWPSLFTWSIQNLKELLSILLIAILIMSLVQLKAKFRFYLLLIIAIASLALKELRMVSFVIFYAVILPFSLILFLWKKNRILFIFLVLLVGAGGAIFINHYLNYSSLLEYIKYMRTVRAYGNTAFFSNIDITNPINFLIFVPVALLVAWLAPFPWQIGSMSQVAAMPEMLLYYALLPAMFLGCGFVMRYKLKEGGIIPVYIFIMMITLASIEGNIGTLFRHRAMVLPFMFVLTGIGLERINFRITAHN